MYLFLPALTPDPRVNYMYTKEYLSLRISGTSIMRVEHISETFTVQYD